MRNLNLNIVFLSSKLNTMWGFIHQCLKTYMFEGRIMR